MGKKLAKVSLMTIALVLSAFIPAAAAAVEYQGYQPVFRDGLYLGAQVNYLSIGGGDFDGNHFLYGYDEIMIIPKLEGNVGFSGLIGFREGNMAGDIGVTFATLNGTFLDYEGDTNLLWITFMWKIYLDTSSELQPYLLLGVDLDFLTVTYGAIPDIDDVDDAGYSGINLDAGAGFSYYITPNIALNIGASIHLMLFTSVSGYWESYDIDETVTGTGINVNAGLIFTLD